MRLSFWCAFLSATLVPSVVAQDKLFEWIISEQPNIQECSDVGIYLNEEGTITNNATQPKPPFYMRAFEANGTTTTSLIGTDPNNLSWKVNHPAGSNLILQVIDSNGNSGGVAPDLYNVIPGSSSSCHHPPLNTSLALVPQITPSKTTLNTCDPLLLAILGGTPPYTLSIAITDALTSPNLTIPPGEDQYLWIDRAPPNNYLIAAACDSKGQCSNGTLLISLTGSDDTSNCTGDAGPGQFIPFQTPSPAYPLSTYIRPGSTALPPPSRHIPKRTVAATVLGAVLFIGFVAFLALAIRTFRRRKLRFYFSKDGEDLPDGSAPIVHRGSVVKVSKDMEQIQALLENGRARRIKTDSLTSSASAGSVFKSGWSTPVTTSSSASSVRGSTKSGASAAISLTNSSTPSSSIRSSSFLDVRPGVSEIGVLRRIASASESPLGSQPLSIPVSPPRAILASSPATQSLLSITPTSPTLKGSTLSDARRPSRSSLLNPNAVARSSSRLSTGSLNSVGSSTRGRKYTTRVPVPRLILVPPEMKPGSESTPSLTGPPSSSSSSQLAAGSSDSSASEKPPLTPGSPGEPISGPLSKLVLQPPPPIHISLNSSAIHSRRHSVASGNVTRGRPRSRSHSRTRSTSSSVQPLPKGAAKPANPSFSIYI